MSTYVIGDIQGCFDCFERLLASVNFKPGPDQLWSVGDLINRGSDNLATLRWFYQHRDHVQVVLGNHDLHLLAVAAGVVEAGRSDNFQDVLAVPDRDTLLAWLQQQPLFHRDGNDVLVHAGIAPQWSVEHAESLAKEVETALQGPQSVHYLRAMYGNEPWRWSEHLSGWARLRVITNYFTRMRYCTPSGGLDLKSKGPQPNDELLNGEAVLPWFAHANQLGSNTRVFFGHWASLNGQTHSTQFIGLDTGCVWGNELTLFCRETGKYHAVSCSANN